MPDAREFFQQLLLLGGYLRAAFHVLQGAAATQPIVLARRFHALRRGTQHFHEAGLIRAALLAQTLQSNLLARQCARHEDGFAVNLGYTTPIVRE